jgi:uncharacterized protein YuzE
MAMVRAWYDPEADALEIRLNDHPVARTVAVTDLHMVDLDAEGRPVAIEILVPSDLRLDEIAARVDLGALLPDIRVAIDGAMSPTSTSSGNLVVVFAHLTYSAEDSPLIPMLGLPAVSGSAASAVASSGVAEELILS